MRRPYIPKVHSAVLISCWEDIAGNCSLLHAVRGNGLLETKRCLAVIALVLIPVLRIADADAVALAAAAAAAATAIVALPIQRTAIAATH
jgi:hypothetical protein